MFFRVAFESVGSTEVLPKESNNNPMSSPISTLQEQLVQTSQSNLFSWPLDFQTAMMIRPDGSLRCEPKSISQWHLKPLLVGECYTAYSNEQP
jgi:hypothetical protein